MNVSGAPRTGPVQIGLIGAGSVTDLYLPALSEFPDVSVRIIGDMNRELAAERAATYGIPESGGPEDVLACADVEIVINVTPPQFHAQVSRSILDAGKNVYSEKPLAVDPDDGRALLDHAAALGLVVASAPDITLNSAFQHSLRLLANGAIGTPVFARVEAVLAGPESWHPRPQFLYAKGAGPLFDIGPYFLTALIASLGPITRVTARGTKKSETRVVGSGPMAGEEFPVEVPTLVVATLEFASGLSAQLLLTFDSASHRGGRMEIFGTEATLQVPDPNGGASESALLPGGGRTEWEPLPALEGRVGFGLGVVNLARHLRGKEALVVEGRRALHVVDLMTAITRSMESGTAVELTTDYTGSPTLPQGWDPRVATL
ncbi:MAG TPA: Gfo/Idh/MocA family oxidoreductase [Propionibacteriaceae bacterium]|nr:Gfo/Idh/MocA family oxidoreductase [Propionibacteriaceae bacterium]